MGLGKRDSSHRRVMYEGLETLLSAIIVVAQQITIKVLLMSN